MLIVFIFLLLIIITSMLFLQHPKFGRLPAGKRLEAIQNSPNYRDHKFQNLSPTPDLTEGASYYKVITDFIFKKDKRNKPKGIIPSVKTNLSSLDPTTDLLIWFGHSSYFIQIGGKRMLIDPVLNGSASPVRFTTMGYKGTGIYTAADIPEIDILFITHDHWDHLDYDTMIKLRPKIKKVITGLGVGEHLERWGFDKTVIIEKDWNESIDLTDGFKVHTTAARHFSGRAFKRQPSLWLSFVLLTPTMKLFLGGDSGYDNHFKQIGAQFGPFDLAILECGQYNVNWKYIHMMPEEVVQAAIDLQAAKLLPVHWGKFSLGVHAWDEPIKRVTAEAGKRNLPVAHPMIGEILLLKGKMPHNAWWRDIV